MGHLNQKVAVITGGSGGIGLAAGRIFVREGAKVLLVDLDEAKLRHAADEIGSTSVKIFRADVAQAQQVQAYVEFAQREFGGLDVLFDNAGVEGVAKPLVDVTEDEFDRLLAVNLKGVWLGIKYAAPAMKRRGGGSIVITSSVAGVRGFAGLGPYVTSKHAIVGLMRTAAVELGPDSIRVNTINPGPIDNRMMRSIETQFAPNAPTQVKAGFEGKIPLGRYGLNEEVGELAAFLAGDQSRYLSGGVYMVDGGFTAG